MEITHGKRLQMTLGEYRRPLTDIVQREQELVVAIELPDIDANDITINLSAAGIEVLALRRIGQLPGHDGYYRFIPLSHAVADIKASFRDSILEVRIPLEVKHASVYA